MRVPVLGDWALLSSIMRLVLGSITEVENYEFFYMVAYKVNANVVIGKSLQRND